MPPPSPSEFISLSCRIATCIANSFHHSLSSTGNFVTKRPSTFSLSSTGIDINSIAEAQLVCAQCNFSLWARKSAL